uniref:Fukutin n=1 Tax=Plectus sambesii TaxID=2011161 RepID=A0A914VU21_9BILA
MTEAGIVFQNKQKSKVKILVRKLIDKTVDYQILLPYSGRVLRTEDHIVAFVRIESFSQVALNGSLLFIPSQPRLFLQRFKRGRFIDCMQPGNGESPIINKKSIQYLAKIRDFFEQFGAMFFLEGGTLLGWYRDCSIIEHTTDLDVSIPIEFYTEAFNRSIFTNDYFRIWKQYGRVNDSLEFVTFLGPFGQGEKLDIFFNYNMFNYSVVGGWAPPDYLLWFKLPKCIGFCSGDLYGRLFAVPCNIKEWLSATYGDDYMTKQAADWERKNGTYSGPQNAQIIGRYNKSDASKTFFHHPFYGT